MDERDSQKLTQQRVSFIASKIPATEPEESSRSASVVHFKSSEASSVTTSSSALSSPSSCLELQRHALQRAGDEVQSYDESRAFWQAYTSHLDIRKAFATTRSQPCDTTVSKVFSHRVIFAPTTPSSSCDATHVRAALAIIMGQYMNSTDVVLGEMISGKISSRPDTERLAALDCEPSFFTVPLCIRLNSAETIPELIARLSADVDRVVRHAHIGLHAIAQIGIEASATCQSQLCIRITDGTQATHLDTHIYAFNHATSMIHCSIFVDFTIHDHELQMNIVFDGRVVKLDQISRLAYQIENLLHQIRPASQGTMVAHLHLVGEEDLRELARINAPSWETSKTCVHSMLQQVSFRQPHALAISAWDGEMTYAELERAAENLAGTLQASGVKPRDFILICIEKSKLAVVAMIAVLKARAAFVHLDPSYPAERVNAIRSATGAIVGVCSSSTASTIRNRVQQLVFLPGALDQTTKRLLTNQVSSPNDPCYVLFTSGSTGTPKGVVVPNSSLCASMLSHGRLMGYAPNRRVFNFSTHTFDGCIAETLTTLAFGGCITVPTDDMRINDTTRAINIAKAEVVMLTPSVARVLDPDDLPFVETLILGGEAVDQQLVDNWRSKKRLMNAYGPTECTIVSMMAEYNDHVTIPATIGRPVGCSAWIVQSHNHNELVLLGAVGELLISGPIVTLGYLNDEEKTSSSFIHPPQWARHFFPKIPAEARLYKTGDLVRYGPDGALIFVGRKDSQVKLHGQRLELNEINHHLSTNPLTKHALAMIPKDGFFREKLTAVVALSSFRQPRMDTITPFMPVDHADKELAVSRVNDLTDSLRQALPAYMVPTAWVVVSDIVQNSAGKLDGVRVRKWLETMDVETHRQVVDLFQSRVLTRPTNEKEEILVEVWKLVLRNPDLGVDHAFLHAGGDSILAMQIVSECRSRGLTVSVQQIMKFKTVSQIAKHAVYQAAQPQQAVADELDTPFPLSPIQRMFFDVDPTGTSVFNQSCLLQARRRVGLPELSHALRTLVDRHSMLRAQFTRTPSGWRQMVTNNIERSYRLLTCSVATLADAHSIIDENEYGLDIMQGPIFAAKLIETGTDQFLHLTAHHLVVDLVSWRILIDDLEALLSKGHVRNPHFSPLPFQQWCRMQLEYTRTHLAQKKVQSVQLSQTSLSFWGVDGSNNLQQDVVEEGFLLDSTTTTLLLGTCNAAFGTSPSDLLLAALVHSFHQTFKDSHGRLQLFSEGHGREVWNDSIDLSGTVGWFTTIFPVEYGPFSTSTSIFDLARHIKDHRRSMENNGLDQFSYRYLSDEASSLSTFHSTMEVLFNFAGVYHRPTDPNVSFSQVPFSGKKPFEEKRTGNRFNLFEITSAVYSGELVTQVQFNKLIKHQPRIIEWICGFHQCLLYLTETLPNMSPTFTPSDFPCLQVESQSLDSVMNGIKTHIGNERASRICDIYPCAAIQQGMLIQQDKIPYLYQSYVVWTIHSNRQPIRAAQLAEAWRTLIEHHTILRTVFVESPETDGGFLQVVLPSSDCSGAIIRSHCDLDSLERPQYHAGQPQHCLTISQSSGQALACRLDINHALMDGATLELLINQLRLAYADPSGAITPLDYRNLIAFIQEHYSQPDRVFWRNYLRDVTPCLFPPLAEASTSNPGDIVSKQTFSGWRILAIPKLDRQSLQAFCQRNDFTLSNLVHLAWALTLRVYTGSNVVCYGYPVCRRDIPLPGVENAAGPYLDVLVQKLDMTNTLNALQALEVLKEDFTRCLDHKFHPLLEILRSQGTTAHHLFNTSISYQRYTVDKSLDEIFAVERQTLYDPSEDTLALNVHDYGTHLEVQLTFWSSIISENQGSAIADTFAQACQSIVTSAELPLRDLNLVSATQMAQISA